MNKSTKARKYNSPLLQELFDEITPLEMEQARNRMQLASCIEDLMNARGWNKSQFAENLGKNPSEITKWLSGTHNFTNNVLTEIAFAFGVDVSTLYGIKKQVPVQVVCQTQVVVRSVASEFKVPQTPYAQTIKESIDNLWLSFNISKNQKAQFPITALTN